MYEIITVAYHTETLEELVVYRALYDDPNYGLRACWVRPLKMFAEKIEHEGKSVLRFAPTRPEDPNKSG